MRLVKSGNALHVYALHVYLSRRNLLALLSKLELPGSACTLMMRAEGIALLVTAEADAEHYAIEGGMRVPGPMEPLTEAMIAAALEFGR